MADEIKPGSERVPSWLKLEVLMMRIEGILHRDAAVQTNAVSYGSSKV